MIVVRISIRKKLEGGFPGYHTTEPFTSEYLVRADTGFPDGRLNQCARRIAVAESYLYPAWVRFDLATVKKVRPSTSDENLRGQFSQIDLDKLIGQVGSREDDFLVFPPVSALYARSARWGRNGRLLLPYVLTITEWNRYVQHSTKPVRFQRVDSGDIHSHCAFSQELLEAVKSIGGAYVMPGNTGEDEATLRQIREFVFMGFEAASSKQKKRRRVKGKTRSSPPKDQAGGEPREGVVYLLRTGTYYKIGKSIGFEKRLGQIKLQLPDPVEVIHTIRAFNPSQAEAHWHCRFAAQRRNGEWFALDKADVDEFKKVSEM